MPMASFFTEHPEIAEAEFRVAIVAGHPHLPEGEYGFLELYCDEPGCDCRRVFIQVVARAAVDQGPLATINFGWESEDFYREWMHGFEEDQFIAEMKGPSLALAPQGGLAPHFLDLFKSMVQDPAYVDRLRRHYELFRGTVENRSREKAQHNPRVKTRVGQNTPCPCGSGKKFKKCCGRS